MKQQLDDFEQKLSDTHIKCCENEESLKNMKGSNPMVSDSNPPSRDLSMDFADLDLVCLFYFAFMKYFL